MVVVILSIITVLGLTEGGSCSGCYFVYHCYLRFGRGVIHVVFVILSNITILFLTEELFMSLLYCLPLLFKV